MKNINLNNVEEVQEFETVKAGGYVCGIVSVLDVSDKEYLKIEYDIAEGKFKNYYNDLFNKRGFWGATTYKSYKEKALPFFKGFITSIEQSNSGYKWDNNENNLVRKLVGFVLGEEEYKANDGNIKTRLYVAHVTSADKIRRGDYTVPPLKKLNESETASYNSTSNSNNSGVISVGNIPF